MAGAGIAFLTHVFLARVLGVEGYGSYTYVLTWITVLSILSNFGFRSTLLRFASAYRVHEEWGKLRGVTRYAERWTVAVGVTIMVLGIIAVLALGDRLSPAMTNAFIIGFLFVPIWALMLIRCSLARAFGALALALWPDSLLRHVLTFVFIAAFLLISTMPLSVEVSLAATGIAILISMFMLSLRLKRVVPAELSSADIDYGPKNEWLGSATPLLFLLMAQLCLNHASILMLGWLSDPQNVGTYAAASRIAQMVTFPFFAINMVFAPTVAALFASGDQERLQQVVKISCWWILVCGLVIALPLFIFAEFVLSIMGPDFVEGTSVLRILLLGSIATAFAGPVGSLLNMTGNERATSVGFVTAAATTIALNMLLIPTFGDFGASIVRSATLAGMYFGLVLYAWHKLKVRPTVFGGRDTEIAQGGSNA
ncbi:MAG: oligosaccharide flippase family protein [Geminicoccaceae bacterium]